MGLAPTGKRRLATAHTRSGHSRAGFVVTQQFQGLSSLGLAEAGYVADRNVAIVGQMVTMGSHQTLPSIW